VFYAAVGRLIREAREERGLSQQALAGNVSLSRASVSNIEQGRQRPPLHTLAVLAGALGVSIERLLPKNPMAHRTLDDALREKPPDEQAFVRRIVASDAGKDGE
jgi:transcriptional regulator with XRE-family HTH domain